MLFFNSIITYGYGDTTSQSKGRGAREMAVFRALGLPEDTSSVPRSTSNGSQPPYHTSSRASDTLFWPPWVPQRHILIHISLFFYGERSLAPPSPLHPHPHCRNQGAYEALQSSHTIPILWVGKLRLGEVCPSFHGYKGVKLDLNPFSSLTSWLSAFNSLSPPPRVHRLLPSLMIRF